MSSELRAAAEKLLECHAASERGEDAATTCYRVYGTDDVEKQTTIIEGIVLAMARYIVATIEKPKYYRYVLATSPLVAGVWQVVRQDCSTVVERFGDYSEDTNRALADACCKILNGVPDDE